MPPGPSKRATNPIRNLVLLSKSERLSQLACATLCMYRGLRNVCNKTVKRQPKKHDPSTLKCVTTTLIDHVSGDFHDLCTSVHSHQWCNQSI